MKTSTIVWIIVVLLVLGGAWYWFSQPSAPATTGPSTTAGTVGSPNQGNLGQPATGSVQQPGGATGLENLTLALNSDSKLGSFLMATNGMTLYTYSKDTAGVSNCTGTCATNWPPYTVPANTTMHAQADATGVLGTVKRADATLQVTYNGKPLYFYKGDSKTGDITGQGIGGVWYIAKP